MSRSKEAAWGASGRGDWRDVGAGHRCPVCGSGSWCQVHRTEPVALCKRVASDRARVNAEGVEFFVHRLDGAAFVPEAMPPAAATVAIAAPGVRDLAHRAVLSACPLAGGHRAALRARGLSDAAIDANGYGTLPREGRARIARAVLDAVGDAAAGVPGYRVRSDGGRAWPSFAGVAGLLVPARDADGRIVALKVRCDEPGDGPKYLYVSSARHGGASAEPALHVPRFAGARDVVVLTEGELKADVCTALTGVLAISAPGVGMWIRAFPALDGWGTRRVRVAFDADAATNPHVARALGACARALHAAGFDVVIERWDPALGKGLDDLLLARARARGVVTP